MAQDGRTRQHRKEAEEYWRDHQYRWETSGLTQAVYCNREGITLSSFTNWRNKLSSGTQDRSGFIEVQSANPSMRHIVHCELLVPAIGVLRIPEGTSPELLRAVLSALKAVS